MEQLNECQRQLNRLYRDYEGIYDSYATAIKFQKTQLWIMYAVCVFGAPLTQYDLCREWNFAKQTINASVNQLVKNGYIKLEDMQDARKRKALTLTARGEDFCKEFIYPLVGIEQEAFESLDGKEREIFLSAFQKYLHFVGTRTAEILTDKKGVQK